MMQSMPMMPMMGSPLMMADYTPPDIMNARQLVDNRKPAFSSLWTRMNDDLQRYRLKKYDGHDMKATRSSKGLMNYTSNNPQVVANKLIGTVEGARVHIEIPKAREVEEQRMANQVASDFVMAALDMADDRLDRFGRPRVLELLANHVVLRGWATGRVLLMRDWDGSTIVDITPWDPRSVVWEVGRNGIQWMCQISSMTYAQIKAAHPEVEPYVIREIHSNDRFTVYDFYDQTFNLVFADGLNIKGLTPHGDTELPGYVTFARGNEEDRDAVVDLGVGGLEYVGESCYQSLRITNDEFNYAMSVRKQILAQEEQRTLVMKSADGSKPLEQDPYKAGQVVQIANQDDLSALVIPPVSKDSDLFTQLVVGEEQRGGLPYTAYGNTPISLSGTALQGLRDDYENQATPFVRAAEKSMQRIAKILLRQYKSMRFSPINIPGQRDMIAPMLVQASDPVKVQLVANYPIDMAGAAATAQMLLEGDPLMSKREIRSKVLRLPDEVGMQDQINYELSERMYPTVRFLLAFRSAMEMGDEEAAKEILSLYIGAKLQVEGEIAMMQAELSMMGLQQKDGEGGTQTIRGGGRRGVAPAQASQQAMGMPTPRQPGQAGSSRNRGGRALAVGSGTLPLDER